MNSRHLILIVLTGVNLVVFAPTSRNIEPARTAQIADKQTAAPSPFIQKMKVVVPKMKIALPPGLGLDGNGMLQPVSKRKIRRMSFDAETGALKE